MEFDYQSQHDDELTIAVGDIISNIRKDEGGWWEGELDGRRGLFPDNFVREIKKESKKEVKKRVQFGRLQIRPVQWQRQPQIGTKPQTRQER